MKTETLRPGDRITVSGKYGRVNNVLEDGSYIVILEDVITSIRPYLPTNIVRAVPYTAYRMMSARGRRVVHYPDRIHTAKIFTFVLDSNPVLEYTENNQGGKQ
jgi:hypothetical protein